jgi:hypothetical protein
MKAYWGVKVQLHTFLTWALDGGEWSASCPGHSGEEKNSQSLPGLETPIIQITVQQHTTLIYFMFVLGDLNAE